jgi:hypothetical protein
MLRDMLNTRQSSSAALASADRMLDTASRVKRWLETADDGHAKTALEGYLDALLVTLQELKRLVGGGGAQSGGAQSGGAQSGGAQSGGAQSGGAPGTQTQAQAAAQQTKDLLTVNNTILALTKLVETRMAELTAERKSAAELRAKLAEMNAWEKDYASMKNNVEGLQEIAEQSTRRALDLERDFYAVRNENYTMKMLLLGMRAPASATTPASQTAVQWVMKGRNFLFDDTTVTNRFHRFKAAARLAAAEPDRKRPVNELLDEWKAYINSLSISALDVGCRGRCLRRPAGSSGC